MVERLLPARMCDSSAPVAAQLRGEKKITRAAAARDRGVLGGEVYAMPADPPPAAARPG